MTLSETERHATAVSAKATALMRRVENTVRDSPKSGYGLNAHGRYFRIDLFDEVLALLTQAARIDPLLGQIEYARAGHLAWAGRHGDAIELYEAIIRGYPAYAQPARVLLARQYGLNGQRSETLRVMHEHNRLLAPDSSQPPLDLRQLGLEA